MKVNTTIKAILMAALAAISYTIPQAQADTGAQMQTALNSIKSDYTDVYALTFTVSTYEGTTSQGSGTGCTLLELRNVSRGEDGYYLITTTSDCNSISLSSDDNKPRGYNSQTQITTIWLEGEVIGDVNTYTTTPSGRNYDLYGIFSQGKNLAHTAPSLAGATYTVAYDGTNSTIVMKTTDGTINKAVLQGVRLDLQAFSFYSTEKGDETYSTITNGSLTSLTDVYTWNGSEDSASWDSSNWALSIADGQSFKSNYDVAFDNEGAAKAVVGDNVTAGNVAVNVDQTIVVEGDNVTFGSTTIADGKTLTLEGGGGTIDLGEVSMVGAKLVVDASEDYLVLLNESAELEVATMTIDGYYHVDFFTDATEVTEGTVTITESLTAGGADLNANLTLVGGSKLNLNGAGENALTLGSTLKLDTESGLIQLDDETMRAIAALEKVGDSLVLVEDGGGHGALSYIGKEWFDGVFSRTYHNDEGLETQLTGDYNVKLLDNGNFGIVKFSNVPEPTTGTLSLLALAALAARRRRH